MWSQCRCDMKTWKVCGDRRCRGADRRPGRRAARRCPCRRRRTPGRRSRAATHERVAAVGAGDGERQAGDDTPRDRPRWRAARPRAARSAASSLARTSRRGQGDRQRAARAPEPHAPSWRRAEPALRYCASAAGEHSASASSSVAVTVRMRSKRLMAKISATTLCSAATKSGASRSRICLGRDHQDPQADAADVLDAGEVEHERALGGGGIGHQRRERRLEVGGASMVDAAHRHGDDGVGDAARCDLQVHPSSGTRRPGGQGSRNQYRATARRRGAVCRRPALSPARRRRARRSAPGRRCRR